MTRLGDRPGEHSSGMLGAAVVAILVFFVQLPFFDRWWSSMDEGHVLLFADIIAKGGDLYRDATLYPLPGAFYALAQLFEAFGPSILLTRWVVVLQFACFAALLWVWARRMLPPAWAAGAIFGLLLYRIWAFPHWHVYSYTTTALLLIAAATACALRHLDLAHSDHRRGLRWLAAAGLLFGLAVYCKQDYGGAALLAIAALLAVGARTGPAPRPAWRPLFVFVGAGALVGACVGAYFAAQGILGDLVEQTVWNHVRGIAAFDYTAYPPLLPLFAQEPTMRTPAGVFAFFPGIVSTVDLDALRQDPIFRDTWVYDALLKLFFWGPYAFVAAAVARLVALRARFHEAATRRAALAELSLAALAAAFVLLLTVNRPQDYLHVAVLYWPIGLLVLVYTRESTRGRAWLGGLLVLVLLAPAGAFVGYSGRVLHRLYDLHGEPIPGERAGVFGKASEVALLGDVGAWVQERTAPGETVAVLPYFPIVHFLADRPGPHRSAYIVWPFAEFADRDQRIIDAIEEQGTDTVVYNFTQFLTFPLMQDFAPELFGHLVRNFEIERVFSYDHSGYKLAGLRRVDAPPEPGAERIDLLDAAWDETALLVESDDGPPREIPPEERPGIARRESWPFRPTLALRPSSGGRRTVFRIPVDVQAGDRLRTAVAVNPQKWFEMPAWRVRFAIRAAVLGEGGDGGEGKGEGEPRTLLWERTLSPHLEFSDRGWHAVELDLDAFAGERIHVELVARVDAPAGESLLAAGFAEPELIRLLDGASGAVAD